MRFVKNYLKENLKWLLLVLACFGILCFVIGFEQVPLAQWGYAAFLCFFLYLLVVIIDFTRRYLHHKKLEKQTSEIAVTMDKLSLPRGQMETDYQKMLRSLYITLQQQINELENGQVEQAEYFTMWVHQIKTPIAAQLGILDILGKYPYEVSGGQKQRAAVARALIIKPELVLADEPTGALDSKATEDLLTLFNKINERGQTILMVTHSTKAASHARRVLFIKDGEVFHQIYRGNLTSEELYAKISDTLTMLTTGGEKHE